MYGWCMGGVRSPFVALQYLRPSRIVYHALCEGCFSSHTCGKNGLNP